MRPLALSGRAVESPSVSLTQLLNGGQSWLAGHTTLGLKDYAREIVASGFPGLRHLDGRALRAQLDGYLQRIVDRDFAEQGYIVRRPDTLRRWLAALARGVCRGDGDLHHLRENSNGGGQRGGRLAHESNEHQLSRCSGTTVDRGFGTRMASFS